MTVNILSTRWYFGLISYTYIDPISLPRLILHTIHRPLTIDLTTNYNFP